MLKTISLAAVLASVSVCVNAETLKISEVGSAVNADEQEKLELRLDRPRVEKLTKLSSELEELESKPVESRKLTAKEKREVAALAKRVKELKTEIEELKKASLPKIPKCDVSKSLKDSEASFLVEKKDGKEIPATAKLIKYHGGYWQAECNGKTLYLNMAEQWRDGRDAIPTLILDLPASVTVSDKELPSPWISFYKYDANK